MTHFHCVLSDRIDIDRRRQDIADGAAPRHFIMSLSDSLNGTLYEPGESGSTAPALIHKVLKTPPALVDLAENVVRNCADDDVIFCISEAIALPIAYSLKKAGKRTKLASFGHNLYRPRKTVANLLWGCLNRVDRFLVFTREAEARSSKNKLYLEQTDDALFSPGATKPARNARPVIVSIGLEQRDNHTLAEATKDLDVDVRITAFSRDATPNPKAQPDPMPANMSAKFYPWEELVSLYRSCDLVAVPVLPIHYAAGITSVLEGAAVGKPIVATANAALLGAVADKGIATWVPAEDVACLRDAIVDLLDDPTKRQAMGAEAHRIQSEYHSFAGRLEFVTSELHALL